MHQLIQTQKLYMVLRKQSNSMKVHITKLSYLRHLDTLACRSCTWLYYFPIQVVGTWHFDQ